MSTQKKMKYLLISNMASPYQVKYCYSLQEYFDAEFWFYEHIGKGRPEWWKIPLGDKCKIMKFSGKIPKVGFFALGVFYDIKKFNPDIIALGGFAKWHWIILKFAKKLNKKVIFMSEPLRFVKSDSDPSQSLLSKENSKIKLMMYRAFFKSADLYLGMGKPAAKQFIDEFKFPEDRVTWTVYPHDIEDYYTHPLRDKKNGEKIKILFANRLIGRYQPILMLEIIEILLKKYPNIELYMNSDGPFKLKCLKTIKEKNLKNIFFLDKIDSWNNMHLIYKKADILVLPATYSNGNGTIIEACASGMGIVMSSGINNMDRLTTNNENCFICNPTIDDFVTGISEYLDNPSLLISHGKLSRKKAEYWKNENTAKRYYELLLKEGLLN